MKIKICVFILLSISNPAMAQDNIVKGYFISEVDSMFSALHEKNAEDILLFYSDGAVKTGVILWQENDIKGIGFGKSSYDFNTSDIKKKLLNKIDFYKITDTLLMLSKVKMGDVGQVSHDFHVYWMLKNSQNTIVLDRTMSQIVDLDAILLRRFYLKFEQLYEYSGVRLKKFKGR